MKVAKVNTTRRCTPSRCLRRQPAQYTGWKPGGPGWKPEEALSLSLPLSLSLVDPAWKPETILHLQGVPLRALREAEERRGEAHGLVVVRGRGRVASWPRAKSSC